MDVMTEEKAKNILDKLKQEDIKNAKIIILDSISEIAKENLQNKTPILDINNPLVQHQIQETGFKSNLLFDLLKR